MLYIYILYIYIYIFFYTNDYLSEIDYSGHNANEYLITGQTLKMTNCQHCDY